MQSWGPPAAPAPAGGGANLGRYVAALKRYKWLILATTILGTIAGLGVLSFIKPRYTVNATLWIAEGPGDKGPITAPELLNATAYQELLTSFKILDPVVSKFLLYLKPEEVADSAIFADFRPASNLRTGKYTLKVDRDGRRYALWRRVDRTESEVDRGAVGDSIGRTVGFLWAPAAPLLGKDRTIEFDVVTPREASVDLSRRLTSTLPLGSQFLRLSLTGERPQQLAATMNALLDEFTGAADALKKRNLTEFRDILQEQLEVAEANLHSADAALEGFKIANVIKPSENAAIVGGVAYTQAPALTDYFGKKVQFDNVRQDRQALEDLVARSRTGGITPEALLSVPSVLTTSPALNTALTDLNTKQASLRTLRQQYTDEHRLVKEMQSQVNALQTQTLPSLAANALTQLRQTEAELDRRIKASSREMMDIPARTSQEQRLTRERNIAENLYTTLKSRFTEAELARASAVSDVSVMDSAVAPQRPNTATGPSLIFIALVAGLGLGLALAILLDLFDKRFRYPEQATNDLGLDVLGAIPTIRRTKSGETRIEEATQLVEAFRALRLNVRNAFEESGPVMLAISSPGAGDGKSLISSNLALSFAESGYRTLLVDGDIRRGQLHTMFQVPQRPGLVDVLTGDVTIDDAICETTHRNMFLIPCGTRRHRGPELLAADGTPKLLRALRSRFDAIIVDTAPLGAGIDPFALGAAAGSMMIVLRTGKTDRKLAQAKLATLDRLPVRLIGAVLNDIEANGMYKYYAYLDGYGTVSEDDQPEQLTAAPGRAIATSGRG